MAATITPGDVFADGQIVTGQRLNDITQGVSFSINDIDRLNFATTTRPITVSGVAPTAITGEGWYDTSLSPPKLKIYNGAMYVQVADEIVLTNKNYAGIQLDTGDVVVLSSTFDMAVDVPATKYQTGILGVVAAPAEFDQPIRVITSGIARVNIEPLSLITGRRGHWVSAMGDTAFNDRRRGLPASVPSAGSYAQILQDTLATDSGTGVLWAYCHVFGASAMVGAVPTGTVIMTQASTCPNGYTRVTAYDGKVLRGSAQPGVDAGSDTFVDADWDVAGDVGIIQASPEVNGIVTTAGGALARVGGGGAAPAGFTSLVPGQHRHNLTGINKLPATRSALICVKI